MLRLSLACAFLLIVALPTATLAQDNPQKNNSKVHLHWGARTGITRYRLQVAADSDFHDIVYDRVVKGTEIDINDLPSGKYFWRIAPLTRTLGDFSSAASIDTSMAETAGPDLPSSPPALKVPAPVLTSPSKAIATSGGWHAVVGDVARPVIGHLRSRDTFDVVATNANGVTLALDSSTGIGLWSTRRTFSKNVPALPSTPPLIIPSAAGLDDVLVFDGVVAIRLEGKTGRELWRMPLSTPPSSAVLVRDGANSIVVVTDSSQRSLSVLDVSSGRVISRIPLPARMAGPVAGSLDQNGQFFIAYESGDLELRDKSGTVVRSGSAASAATTGPLVVKARRDDGVKRQDMILVDTREGLTGITAGDLKPLGRVTSKQEMSRGSLTAADLDGDGDAEVLVATQDGYLLAIRSDNGKMVWSTTVTEPPQAMAFADLDGDNVLDVIMTTANSFAVALSGKDGSPIWKDAEGAEPVANRANVFPTRGIAVAPLHSGVVVIATDAAHTGLRAIEFPNATVRR
jgi:outer membrane protein assembly factor BamB